MTSVLLSMQLCNNAGSADISRACLLSFCLSASVRYTTLMGSNLPTEIKAIHTSAFLPRSLSLSSGLEDTAGGCALMASSALQL